MRSAGDSGVMARRIAPVLMMICAAAAVLAVDVIAPPCEGVIEAVGGRSVPMRCHYMIAAAHCFALLWVAFAVESYMHARVAAVPLAVSGLCAISMTFAWAFGIGVCANTAMQCSQTALWMRGAGALIVAVALVSKIDIRRQI